jgi:hypothetical protein
MSSNKLISVSIQPLDYVDVPTCAQITSSAFATDPHTIIKQLGRKPFDMYTISSSNFFTTLDRTTYVYVKAVDKETNEIVGHAGWMFRGVDEELIPRRAPGDEKPIMRERKNTDGLRNEDEGGESEGTQDEDSIDRLHALEDGDMKCWLSAIIPPDTPCMCHPRTSPGVSAAP